VQAVLRDGLPFSDAKQLLINEFEQRYLHETLRAHQGNVSQAARTARKNRRAFWALMSRHRITAAPYRTLVDAAPENWGRPVQ
jgi:DNA-binding NtrC family response regulator